jgi:hypothetical protein
VFESDVVCQPADPPCEAGQACIPASGCVDLPDPPLSTPCEADGGLCTNDQCDGNGGCVFESDVVCPDDVCGIGVCDPDTGNCGLQPITPCCGNDVTEIGEECDGTDDAVCDPFGCLPPGDPEECLCDLLTCGDGLVDPNVGEECDPPQIIGEICDNRVDDDGDGLADCRDPDCPAFCTRDASDPNEPLDLNEPCTNHRECRQTFGRDAECVSQGSCGSRCVFINKCTRIDKDPGLIRFGRTPEHPDLFSIHGRFPVIRAVDPTVESFVVSLSNANGTIFEGRLFPGDMVQKGKVYVFKDKTAKKSDGIRDGLNFVKIKLKVVRGRLTLVFRVRAYGDFSSATDPLMAFRVTLGTEGGFNEAEWNKTSVGWKIFF